MATPGRTESTATSVFFISSGLGHQPEDAIELSTIKKEAYRMRQVVLLSGDFYFLTFSPVFEAKNSLEK